MVLRLALLLLALLSVAAGAVVWRLQQGPIDVSWLVRLAEPLLPQPAGAPRIAVGGASIAWQQGPGGGLRLQLRDVRTADPSPGTAPQATIGHAEATLSLPALLQAQAAPRRVSLTGVKLHAIRRRDGSLDFGLDRDVPSGETSPVGNLLSEVRRPASDGNDGSSGLGALSELAHVTLRDAMITIADEASGKTLRADIASLDLDRPADGGLVGQAIGRLGFGAAMAELGLTATLSPEGGTHVEGHLAPLGLAALAQANPSLTGIGALDAAVRAYLTLDLSPALMPRSASVRASTEAGTLTLGSGVGRFDSVALEMDATWEEGSWRPQHIGLARAAVAIPSPSGGPPSTVTSTGAAKLVDDRYAGEVGLTLDHASFADLPGIWPEAWGGHTRPWLTENVTAGTVHDGVFHVQLSAAADDPAQIRIEAAGGTMRGDDVTIHWLRPVPPIEHAQALLTVINPDALDIAVPHAAQGPIALDHGVIHITGLSAKDQSMSIATSVQGAVPDVLALLRQPRLRLLDRHKLPIQSSAGSASATLSVDLPLVHHLEFEQVGIGARGRLGRLRLGGILAGKDLDRGDISFDVTQDGLKASGQARLASIASRLAVEMDFRAGPMAQVTKRATLAARAVAAELRAAGMDTGTVLTAGAVGIAARYEGRRDGRASLDVDADLTAAGLSLPGWRKPPGPAAHAAARLSLQDERVTGVDRLEAAGPALRVVGRAELVDGRPLGLRLDTVVLGATRARGAIDFPASDGDPLRVRLEGPRLDLSGVLADDGAGRRSGGRASGIDAGPPFVGDVRFDQVVLSPRLTLAGVRVQAEHDRHRLRTLQAETTGPERIRIALVPQGDGRHLSVRAADAGALLQAVGAGDTLNRGLLAIEAQFDDRLDPAPLAGTLDMQQFGVRDAVVVGKLLQAVTVYGIPEALRGKGVQFSRLLLPFKLDQTVLQIGEARAFSASLGLTATGWIDFGRDTLDLRGTIVPAYVINSALGRLPVVGRYFSPERGGGLIAVRYGVMGRTADPSVSVNPFTALTPGILRGLFALFS